MSKICLNENCNETVRYGVVNQETGMFEKFHCKNHKENNEIGNPPKWMFRYFDMNKITSNKNIKLLDSEEIFIEKTSKYGCKAYLNLQCLVCLDIVNQTTISNFVNYNHFGCSCNKNIPWHDRREQFLDICEKRNVKLLDSKQEFIRKTKKNAQNAYLLLQCLVCLDIVETTTINRFVNQDSLGCSCNTNFKYSERYPEVLEICKNINIELLDSEEEYIEKTKENGAKTKLNLKCLICLDLVTTTTIDGFIKGHLNCSCSKFKSEKCLGEILKDIFPEYEFKKIQPDWLKNPKTNKNLELDYYNEELKKAYEYQGRQHEQYNEFFHQQDINNFYKQQQHDRIKKEVCEENGIKLICIPSKYDYTNPLEMCDFILENL